MFDLSALDELKHLRHTARVMPGVSPNLAAQAITTTKGLSVSEWARKALHFDPSKTQADLLDDTSDRWLILCCARQWGKSTTMAIKALHKALTRPKTVIVVLSKSEVQAGIIVNIAAQMAATLNLKPGRVRGRKFSVKLANGSCIYAVPHSATTVLGQTIDILIVDEAAYVSEEVLCAILPALTRTNGRVWMVSTPNGQTGFFYKTFHDKTNTHKWLKLKATIEDSKHASPEFLEQMQKLFPRHRFLQDFYCEFQAPGNRVFTREQLEGAINRDPAEQWSLNQPRKR